MPEPRPAKKAAAAKPPQPAAATDSIEHPNLAAALVAFMLDKPMVTKGQTATIPGRDGRTGYSYKYADLADVDAAATPILAAHGLAFVSVPRRTDNGSYELVGTLMHTSGETLEGPLPLQGRTAQELGSSLTYMRRYLLGSMTGIVTDDDDDGSRAQAAREQTRPEPPPEQQPRQSDPPHIVAALALIRSLTQEERDNILPWWDKAAAEGHLPIKENVAALTPAQFAWVEEVVGNLRDRLAEGPIEHPAAPDPS